MWSLMLYTILLGLYFFSGDYFDLDHIFDNCTFGSFVYFGHLHIWAIGADSWHRLLDIFLHLEAFFQTMWLGNITRLWISFFIFIEHFDVLGAFHNMSPLLKQIWKFCCGVRLIFVRQMICILPEYRKSENCNKHMR